MGAVRAQVILKTNNAISEDFATNSWCFTGEDTEESTTQLTVSLAAFYNTMRPYLGGQMAQNGHLIKFSNLPGVKPNYPFIETSFNLTTAPSGDPAPSEVALCLSFQGSRASGFPQARRRGRVFIGPLLLNTSSVGRPTTTIVTALAGAGDALKTSVDAITGDVAWAVWSQVDQAAVPVTDGWVDNAFDTVRRRGIRPNSRTTFN